jgi:hypothetical protein
MIDVGLCYSQKSYYQNKNIISNLYMPTLGHLTI